MGIRVECPHGHVFKVKDKYAGKKGLCPHCEGQVIVLVPDVMTTPASDIIQREAIQRRQSSHLHHHSDSDVFDDDHPAPMSSGTSGSLLGSSVIRHNIKCQCGEHVPMWYARCPACGQYLDH